MATNYNFRILNTKPATTGWTSATITAAQQAKAAADAANSAVGPTNALAQQNISADALRTTPSTLSDSKLGSRAFKNPNTGIRDVAASGSVYNMSNVPSYLSQAVNSLNSEQALQRAVRAEWQDKLLRNAHDSTDPYIWLEAIRAASIGPGSSASFGQAIQDPNRGRADLINATTNQSVGSAKARILSDYSNANYQTNRALANANAVPTGFGWSSDREAANNELTNRRVNQQYLAPVAASIGGMGFIGGGGGSGWVPNRSTSAWF